MPKILKNYAGCIKPQGQNTASGILIALRAFFGPAFHQT